MTLNDLVNSSNQLLDTATRYLGLTLGIVATVIVIHLINLLLKRKLNFLGLIPRRLFGLPGIIFSPLLHQDFSHLLFNLFPLFILTNLLLVMGFDTYLAVTVILIFMTGLLTWLFGRMAVHIGASSLVLGYWGFLLMSLTGGITVSAILTVFICIYYFGNFIFSIIPQAGEEGGGQVSWEGHLFGLLSGLALGYEWFLDHGKLIIAIAHHTGLA